VNADDQDEVRKLQAVTLIEIFQERLAELRREFPQVEGEDDDDAGMLGLDHYLRCPFNTISTD